MPPLLPLSPTITITTCVLATPPTIYFLNTYRALRPSFAHAVRASRSISPSLARSQTVDVIVNPTRHGIGGDVHSVIIPVSQLPRGSDGKPLSDKELLGRLATGFFGGWVFTPERWALRAWSAVGGARLLDVAAVEAEAQRVRREVWTAEEVTEMEKSGWEVGVMVSAAFQVADMGMEKEARDGEEAGNTRSVVGEKRVGEDLKQTESYIDFVFGSDKGRLKGAHRFAVVRRTDEGKEVCELQLAGVACNPQAKRALPSWLIGFHLAYSQLLFREAVAAVLAVQRGGTR